MNRNRHPEYQPTPADWMLLLILVLLAVSIPVLIVVRHFFGIGSPSVEPWRWYTALLVSGLAILICSTNFYLSVIRPRIHVLLGRNPERYQHVSGIPLFGNLLLGVAAILLPASVTSGALLLFLLAIDTGAIHWAVLALLRDR